MTPDEMALVLTQMRGHDGRRARPDRVDVAAWMGTCADLDFDDARRAVDEHYARSTDWMMAMHLRELCAGYGRARLEAAPPSALLPDADPDDVAEYVREQRARVAAVAHPSRRRPELTP